MIKNKNSKKTLSVSVIICTVNRLETIKLNLDNLKKQLNNNFEVIIVDGRLDNKLADVCSKYAMFLSLRRVKVRKWNLAYQRNVGIAKMKSKIAAFIDDDAMANNDWINNIIKTFKGNIKLEGIGGKILSANSSYLSMFAERLFDYGPIARPVKTITGANMILNIGRIRRHKRIRPKIFNEQFNFAGEETDACFNLIKNNCKLSYEPTVVVTHYFETNLEKFIKKHVAYGRGDFIVNSFPKYSKFNLIQDYSKYFKVKYSKIFFPFLIIFPAILKCIRFTLTYGLIWLPGILIRESSYLTGVYSAMLKSQRDYNTLPE